MSVPCWTSSARVTRPGNSIWSARIPRSEFPGFLSAHESRRGAEPVWTRSDYVDFCLDFCRERRIDCLWPGKEARLLVAHRERFAEQGVRGAGRRLGGESGAFCSTRRASTREARRFSIPPPDSLEFRTAGRIRDLPTHDCGHPMRCCASNRPTASMAPVSASSRSGAAGWKSCCRARSIPSISMVCASFCARRTASSPCC